MVPARDPAIPILEPVKKKMRKIIPRLAPIVRKMAISRELSFTSISKLQGCNHNNQRQNQEHHVPFNLKSSEEFGIELLPIKNVGVGGKELIREGFEGACI